MKANARDEQGQALVETALSMSLLILIMLGAVEFGMFTFAAIEVSNSAKAAAQYGAQNHGTALNTAGMLAAAQNEYYSTGLTMTSPVITAGAPTAGYTCTCAGSGAAVSCTDNSVASPPCAGSYVQVQIKVATQATFNPGIHVAGISSITLHGNAVQMVLQ
jgi:Flp pilus assembly protein TadG